LYRHLTAEHDPFQNSARGKQIDSTATSISFANGNLAICDLAIVSWYLIERACFSAISAAREIAEDGCGARADA
jgi:hypothetical protein